MHQSAPGQTVEENPNNQSSLLQRPKDFVSEPTSINDFWNFNAKNQSYTLSITKKL